MKKKSLTVLSALMAASLCACAPHSSYRATALVRSSTSTSASLSFWTLEGQIVFTLKHKNPEAHFHYAAEVETGSFEVELEIGKNKTILCEIEEGEKEGGLYDPLATGTVYLILKTSSPCTNGKLDFEIVD